MILWIWLFIIYIQEFGPDYYSLEFVVLSADPPRIFHTLFELYIFAFEGKVGQCLFVCLSVVINYRKLVCMLMVLASTAAGSSELFSSDF